MSAYYSSYQAPAQPSASPPSASSGPSVASMAAAALHWHQFSEFGVPYYFPTAGQNFNSRYQPGLQNYHPHHHHHHHPLHHQSHPHPQSHNFQQQFSAYQQDNCGIANAASSPSPPTSGAHSNSESPTNFPSANVKTDPGNEDRLQPYQIERYEARLSNSTPLSSESKSQTFPQASPVPAASGQNLYNQQQQTTMHQHRGLNPQSDRTSLLTPGDGVNNNPNRTIRDFLTQNNSSSSVMATAHTPEFGGCISPSSLATTATDPNMGNPSSPYYDMYGTVNNPGSICPKGSSFYPWMKHYSRKNSLLINIQPIFYLLDEKEILPFSFRLDKFSEGRH